MQKNYNNKFSVCYLFLTITEKKHGVEQCDNNNLGNMLASMDKMIMLYKVRSVLKRADISKS
jgi:hypothetical protein